MRKLSSDQRPGWTSWKSEIEELLRPRRKTPGEDRANSGSRSSEDLDDLITLEEPAQSLRTSAS